MKKDLTKAVVLGLICASVWHGSVGASFYNEGKEADPNVDSFINIIDTDESNKRLNILRTDPSEVGVWLRGATGDTEIRQYEYDYTVMSGGYDWVAKNNAATMFYGIGVTYSTNDCNNSLIGDTDNLGFSLYGSWLGKKNNDYVDLVVRYGRLEKEFGGDMYGTFLSGDYDKSLFAISAKYGRRITTKDGWYYEPFAGFIYGRTGGADFIETISDPYNPSRKIHSDSTDSKIVSLGVQVGKNIKGIEYFAKAEMFHDFDGEIRVSDDWRAEKEDMGGTWYKLAIGASRKINDNNSFYIDIEKDFANKVKRPYSIGFGYRHSW